MGKSKFQVNYQPTARVAVDCSIGGRTKSEFKAECDVNNIMRKFAKNQLFSHVNQHNGDYGDFTSFDDYHTSVNSVLAAQDAFSTVPAGIRAEFQNDPAVFLEFVQNPENLDRMVEMGLAIARPSDVSDDPPKAPPKKSEPAAPSKEDAPPADKST